ncbi:MAG TPA: hypothetical protein VE972_05305 [Conexibacter sp.]|nr:hypothetical protein [Conexibacter sp.]
MRTHHKLILAALATVIALSLGASTATGLRSLEARPGGPIAATGRSVSFSEPGGLVLSFDLTLSGRLGTRIGKRVGARFGQIERCAANNAREGAFGFTILIRCELNLPWPITYDSIRGTLPRITSVLVAFERVSLLFESEVGRMRVDECLYQGNLGFDSSVPPITTLTLQPVRNTIELVVALEQTIKPCVTSYRFSTMLTVTRTELRLL